MKKIRLILFVYLALSFYTMNAQTSAKPRVIATTDLGADPDDLQSMVRFLVQSNEFDVKGIIAATGCWKTTQSTTNMNNLLNPILDAYESSYNNLKVHSPDYPTPSYLRSVSVLGQDGYGMGDVGSGKDSDGSNLIIAAVDAASEENPVWVLFWGGGNNLAQALWKVQSTRTQAQLDEFISKVRAYDILGQDDAGAWMAVKFPKLIYIRATLVYNWQPSTSWVDSNVQNHGALGAVYPDRKYAMEGDTPAFLHLVGRGLNNPSDTKQRGWGGQFVSKKANITSMSQVAVLSDETQWGTYYMYGNSLGPEYFKPYIDNDFAARMDWSVSSNFSSANHHPKVVLNGDETEDILKIYVAPGQNVQLSASGTTDPDNNSLTYKWLYYQTDGTYGSDISISGNSSQTASVTVPSDAQDKEMHFVVAVNDNGSPSLVSYRRAIIIAGNNPVQGPIVTITSPTNGASLETSDNVPIEATAVAQKGYVTGVEFKVDGTTVGTDNSAPYTAIYSNATGGVHSITAVATDSDGDQGSDAVDINVTVPQEPYGGIPRAIPGTIEFEHFDEGGNGTAYYDDSPGSETGNSFRDDEDVDIEDCEDIDGGYNIGYSTAGEWLEYTVNVVETGKYNLGIRVACNGDGRTVSLSGNGNSIASNIAIPNTGGWQTWTTVNVSDVTLTAGTQVLRFTIGATDYVNLNKMTFTSVGGNLPPTVSILTPNNGTTYLEPADITINANALDSDGSVSKVEFFQGATSLGIDNSAPYSVTWNSIYAGSYNLTAVATDNEGASTTSSIVNISVSIEGEMSITIQENETGFVSVDGTIDINNPGFTGDGFANTDNASGKGVNWEICVPENGTYSLEWRYANGSADDRNGQLEVDGVVKVSKVSFPSTGSWSEWDNSSAVIIALSAGTHQIRLEATISTGLGNIDYITITGNEPQAGKCSSTDIPVTGVSVSPTSASISVLEIIQLTGAISPSNATNKNVSWISSNSSIASVSSTGLVTGMTEGSASITVTTQDGGFTASCNVSVSDLPTLTYELATSVVGQGSVTPSSGTYEANEQVTLTAVPASDWKFVSWSGDASGSDASISIAMDANKSVTATFIIIDDDKTCLNPSTISLAFTQNGVGEFCWFTEDAIAYVNSWNLNSLTINGSDYTNTWSDNMPARIDGGYYIAYSGLYSWAHFETAGALKSTSSMNLGNVDLSIYPNPFDDKFIIDLNGLENIKRIIVLNTLGQVIYTKTEFELMNDLVSIQIDDPGNMFIVQLHANDQVYSKPVIRK